MTDLPHGDVVGSLLRPPELLAAREAIEAGSITDAEFKRVEDQSVDDADLDGADPLARQEERDQPPDGSVR